MNQRAIKVLAMILLAPLAGLFAFAADDTVATAVSARVGNGYKREKLKDGSFKPEFYALSEGGRIAGTTSDFTVDKVGYHEVAERAMRLLAQQNYRYYGQTTEQPKLLLVLFWGNTIAEHGTTHEKSQASISLMREALGRLNQGKALDGTAPPQTTSKTVYATPEQVAAADTEIKRMLMDSGMRAQLNWHNASLLGYASDLQKANGIQRYAGGGDHYNDLLADLDVSRYYIVILAYDFEEFTQRQKKKLLWETRVSVGSADNRFDDSVTAMLKGAAKYFGQDSGKLVRNEETKATVELGNLKFLGETGESAPAATPPGTKSRTKDKK